MTRSRGRRRGARQCANKEAAILILALSPPRRVPSPGVPLWSIMRIADKEGNDCGCAGEPGEWPGKWALKQLGRGGPGNDLVHRLIAVPKRPALQPLPAHSTMTRLATQHGSHDQQ